MSNQIPLDLPANDAFGRDDWITGAANALAAQMIDAWPDWPGNLVVLCGPAGVGKSHLARVWADMAEARIVRMDDVRAGWMPAESCLVIEDARAGRIDEAALFACLNHLRTQGGYCLITSRVLPGGWNVKLPDLVSRLRAAQIARLEEPDDDLLKQVIVKLFADRQIQVAPDVVGYLVDRMERSLGVAVQLVADIDREALSRGVPVTKRLAAGALERKNAG